MKKENTARTHRMKAGGTRQRKILKVTWRETIKERKRDGGNKTAVCLLGFLWDNNQKTKSKQRR